MRLIGGRWEGGEEGREGARTKGAFDLALMFPGHFSTPPGHTMPTGLPSLDGTSPPPGLLQFFRRHFYLYH